MANAKAVCQASEIFLKTLFHTCNHLEQVGELHLVYTSLEKVPYPTSFNIGSIKVKLDMCIDYNNGYYGRLYISGIELILTQ